MFYKIINLIKVNLKLKNKIIKTKLYKKDFETLKIFLKLNIIKYIKKHYEKNEEYFYIYINTDNSFKNIINLHKPSKPKKINLKNITKINRKKNNLFYLTTNSGLINNYEAEKKKIGGFLVMNIWI